MHNRGHGASLNYFQAMLKPSRLFLHTIPKIQLFPSIHTAKPDIVSHLTATSFLPSLTNEIFPGTCPFRLLLQKIICHSYISLPASLALPSVFPSAHLLPLTAWSPPLLLPSTWYQDTVASHGLYFSLLCILFSNPLIALWGVTQVHWEGPWDTAVLVN